jgi:DNA repair exonuclease SbcCD ATPase subunit
MRIHSVEFRNFNSYGNKITKVDFEDRANMIMLIGQSGHGKSTIREVISYLAYGKVQDKNLGDLPNRVNKTLWGKVVMTANNANISIERGIKPNVFEVTINGEPLETAGKNNIQDILETEYFKIPQSTFDNVISVSVDKFKSFLTMSIRDKRKILDQIFGIAFFNQVNDQLREQVRDFNSDIKMAEGQVTVLTESSKEIEDKIKSVGKQKTIDITKKVQKLIKDIEKTSKGVTKLTESSTTVQSKVDLVNDKYSQFYKEKTKYESEIKTCETKIKLYDNEKCPECGGNLDTDEHHASKKVLEDKKIDLAKSVTEYKEKLDKLEVAKQKIFDKQKEIGDSLFSIKMELKTQTNEKKKLEGTKEVDTTDFDELLESTLEKIQGYVDSLEGLKKSEYIYTELTKIFGEDGVKLQLMRNFLPAFNKNINEFSKKLHFPYKIEIDERFNSNIISIGEEINPKTLSTGERKKADFAVLVSLIKIMKQNYPSINLLFLDEILASIDSYGVYEMLKLIRDTVDELNLHAFVINHSELPSELFDSIYSVNKVGGGFSELEIKPC